MAAIMNTTSGIVYVRGISGTLQVVNGTNAQVFEVYNTFTSSTNFEKFSVDWQTLANTNIVGNRTGTTGNTRELMLITQGNNAEVSGLSGIKISRNAPFLTVGLFNTSGVGLQQTGALEWVRLGYATNGATSGAVTPVTILPTYNQSASTAANTDLLINRTQTAIGSGLQLFLDAQVAGASKFRIGNTGVVYGGGAVAPLATVTTEATAGAVTFTAAQIVGGLILRDPNGASRADLVPTAANLLAAVPAAAVGQAIRFTIRNTADAAETITVTTNTGVTLSGTMTIAQSNSKSFLAVFTNVTAASEAYTLYSLGTVVF
jgi:hypothetical protein